MNKIILKMITLGFIAFGCILSAGYFVFGMETTIIRIEANKWIGCILAIIFLLINFKIYDLRRELEESR